MNQIHKTPESCLTTMSFQYSDGGRAQYIEELDPPELPTGDCAVVAMVHAINAPPTAGAYQTAVLDLTDRARHLRLGTVRKRGESTLALLLRKVVGWLSPRTAYMNPIHETLTPVYDWLLEDYGYAPIFEVESGPESLCICHPKRAYVVEGFTDTGGAHVTTVWSHTVLGNYDASQRRFQITNIWMLPPATKSAIEEHQKAEEAFLLDMKEWLADPYGDSASEV